MQSAERDLGGSCEVKALALDLAATAFEGLEKSREDAESRADSYVRLARAIYVISPAEARVYFDRAVEIGADALQIFSDNPTAWRRRPEPPADAPAFVAFCAISSAGYLINDLRDVAFDRRHPEKRHRPIASGALSERVAWGAAVVRF